MIILSVTLKMRIFQELTNVNIADVSQCYSGGSKNWFCFGGENDRYACKGDSGSPVMVMKENK